MTAGETHTPALPPLHLRGVAVASCLLAIFAIGAKPVVDPDFWWHLATGRYMLSQHLIPRNDVFSLTAQSHRWITHEWASELLFYGGWSLGGARLLSLVSGAVIALVFGVVLLAARERGSPPQVSVPIAAVAALASAHTYGVRPQMLSLLLMALFSLAIARMLVRSLPAPPLWLPLAMVLWVNLHGGFIFGLALLAIATAGYVVQDRIRGGRVRSELPAPFHRVDVRRCALVVALTAAATLANPNGLAGALYPLSYLGNNASTRYIAEWVSPDFHQTKYLFFEALVLILLVAALASPRRARLADVLVLLPFLYLAFESVRNINLFAVLAAPIGAELVTWALPLSWVAGRQVRTLPRGRSVINWLVVLAIAVGIGATVLGNVNDGAQARALKKDFPVGALHYIQAHGLPSRGFDSYNWGGYLIWNWYGQRRVFVDGRPDMYGDAFMDRYVRAYEGNASWQALFAQNVLCYALVEPGSGIARALRMAPGWQVRFQDAEAVLFEATHQPWECRV